MIAQLPMIEELPKESSTQVKNRWGDVVRQVKEAGTLAITHHSTVEMVMLSAATYRKMRELMIELSAREEQAQLDDLTSRFQARLAGLQRPDVRLRLDAMLATKGKRTKRAIAGESY